MSLPSSSRSPDAALVIPCFRESRRLPPFLAELVAALGQAPFTSAIQAVDDGSPAAEQAALMDAVKPMLAGRCEVRPLICLPDNRLKGGAILAGWKASPDAAWLAFVDADGAVPAGEVRRLLELAVSRADPATVYSAARTAGAGRRSHRRLSRLIASRCFARAAGWAAGFPLADPQCGFKAVSQAAFAAVSPGLADRGLCFDVELLATAHRHGCRIEEIPIDWREQSGGSIGLWHHAPPMLRELWRIRRARQQPQSSPRPSPIDSAKSRTSIP
jgi:dolichyl-phosphate beta-glucosyltransferase